MTMTRQLLLAAFVAILLTACGGDDAGSDTVAPLTAAEGGNPLFERIDADTVMIGANLAPAPDAVIDHVWQSTAAMNDINDASQDEISESLEGESPILSALFKELSSIEDRESFEALGVHANGFWAAHMVSVYPVFHVELIDAAAFQAMLDRIAEDSETPLPTRQLDGEEVIWIDADEFGVAIHHDDRFATLAVIPDDEALLRRVANLDRPEQAFDAERLASFNSEQGFVAHGSGFMDMQGFVGRLMDADNDRAAPARASLDMQALVSDPACQTEMSALMAVFPRITAGFSALDTTAIDMKMAFETDADMAERMRAISDTPVGLTSSQPQTLSAGVAFDPVAARDFARELVDAWVASPPKCAAFAPIAAGASEWQRALNRPIPPVATNIRGFQVNIDEVAMGDSGQVDDARGTLALFVRNPQMLLGMAQMFSPEVAAMGVEQNGEPKPLPAGLIPNMPAIDAFVALSDEAIGLSVGEGQQDRLPAALASHDPDGAIFAYAINFEGYSELMESMMSQLGEMEGVPADELPPADFMAQFAEMYDTSSMAIKLTDQGIEIESRLTMKE